MMRELLARIIVMRTAGMKLGAWLTGSVIALLIATTAGAATSGVLIELNKLKPVDNACRAFLVTQNLTDKHFKKLKLDLVMFNKKGIVARRLAIGLGPLRPGKTSVKVFDISKIKCQNLGQFLMNGTLACTTPKGPVENCTSLISVSARGSISFIQ